MQYNSEFIEITQRFEDLKPPQMIDQKEISSPRIILTDDEKEDLTEANYENDQPTIRPLESLTYRGTPLKERQAERQHSYSNSSLVVIRSSAKDKCGGYLQERHDLTNSQELHTEMIKVASPSRNDLCGNSIRESSENYSNFFMEDY